MRILDKYILKEFISPFLFGVAAFTSIFLGADTLLKIANYVTTYGASTLSALKIFLLALPQIIIYTFPMAILLGSLMAMYRLSGDSELVIMRTSGQSFLRLARPIFIFAFIISIGTILFNEYVVPWTNTQYEYVINHEIKQNLEPKSAEHVVLRDVEDGQIKHLLYARRYNAETKKLENITIQEFQNDKVIRIENAPFANWQNGIWNMTNGIIYDLSDDGVQRMVTFKNQIIPYIQTPEEIGKTQRSFEQLTIRELIAIYKAYESAHTDTTAVIMEIEKRFSLPMASFLFALIGAPLGVKKGRSSSSLGFGLSVAIIFAYYAIMTFLEAMGKGHILPATLAVWLPNIIVFFCAIYLIRQKDGKI